MFVVAIGVAVLAAGCFGGDDEAQVEVEGRAAPQLVERTAVNGGLRRERTVLEKVVAGMDRTTLTRIAIGAPGDRREVGGAAVVPLAFTPVAGQTVRRQWDEWIVAGAFSRRLDAAGLPARVDGGDQSRRFTARPRVKGQPDPRPLTSRQERALVERIRSAATRSGGDVVGLEVHRPYGAAIALSLVVQDPARFLEDELRQLMARLGVHRPRLEGIYLAVLDGGREIVLEWGSWTRNPAGSYWVRADLASCSPIKQSEPPGTEPPPDCPV